MRFYIYVQTFLRITKMIFIRHLFVCYLLAKRNNRKRNENKENKIQFEVMCRHLRAYVALKKGNKIE